MRMIDCTISLGEFIRNNIEGAKLTHYPDSGIGNYEAIRVFTGEIIKGGWFWGDLPNEQIVAEIINGITVRIPARSFDRWNEKIMQIVADFEGKTKREVLIKKVNSEITFSPY